MTIAPGTGGLTAGYLYLKQFTQAGSAAINLTGTGTSAIYLGPTSSFGGTMTATAPDIYFNGATFNGTVNATKTGANNDYSSGANTFQASATLANAGTGLMALGNGTADIFNGSAIFNSTGSSIIAPAWNSAGNMFNGNIVVSSTGSSQGVWFWAVLIKVCRSSWRGDSRALSHISPGAQKGWNRSETRREARPSQRSSSP